jgi:hypothetical protein
MPTERESAIPTPECTVLGQVAKREWPMVGEAKRRPGLSARHVCAEAGRDAASGDDQLGAVYAAILRSEERISLES